MVKIMSAHYDVNKKGFHVGGVRYKQGTVMIVKALIFSYYTNVVKDKEAMHAFMRFVMEVARTSDYMNDAAVTKVFAKFEWTKTSMTANTMHDLLCDAKQDVNEHPVNEQIEFIKKYAKVGKGNCGLRQPSGPAEEMAKAYKEMWPARVTWEIGTGAKPRKLAGLAADKT